jgi:hypothetical protein
MVRQMSGHGEPPVARGPFHLASTAPYTLTCATRTRRVVLHIRCVSLSYRGFRCAFSGRYGLGLFRRQTVNTAKTSWREKYLVISKNWEL